MNFFLNVVVISIGLSITDFFMTSVSFPDLISVLVVAVLFTGIASLISGYVRNPGALFILNLFIFYMLSEFISEFKVNGLFSLVLLTLFVSIVEALFSNE